MRILIVSQYFWPEEFRINDLALDLLSRGHRVSVLTGLPNYPAGRFFPGYGFGRIGREEYRGLAIRRVPVLPRGKGGGLRLLANYLSFALFGCLLGPFFCPEKIDLILVYEPSPVTVGLPALLLKKLKKAPLFFWVQDLWPETLAAVGAVKSPRVLRAVDRLVRFIYKGCDLVLIQSRSFADYISTQGVETARLRYFPNSAEGFYQPLAADGDTVAGCHLPPGFRVMFAGNIGEAQDFPTILRAAEILREERQIKWLIVGDGRKRAWVEAEIEKRGLAGVVHLLGRHAPETMPEFFARADVLLVTLKKNPVFSLTIPSKIQSYLAVARPVVAALDGEGGRIIEESGAGFWCPAESPELLAEKILALSRLDPEERQAMGRKARRYFEANFAAGKLTDRLEEWMREMTGKVD
jgi:glycosyltransferase involved in cell wall biosynthesis